MQIINSKTIRRKATYIILVFGILIGLLLIKDQYSHLLLFNNNYGMESLIRRGEIHYLFVGSSTFRQGLDINVLENELGDCYILSYNGNQPYTEYIQIRKLIENGVIIDNLYMDMYAYTICRECGLDDEKLLMELDISEKWELFSELQNKRPSTFWQIFVSSNNEQILTWPIVSPIIDSQFKNGGTLVETQGMNEESYYNITPVNSDGIICKAQEEAIKQIILLCRRNAISIKFVETPKASRIMYDPTYERIMTEYNDFLDDENVEVIRPDLMIYEYSDFADGIHLSTGGRRKYTQNLVNTIKGIEGNSTR